jgi:hypothetical protein
MCSVAARIFVSSNVCKLFQNLVGVVPAEDAICSSRIGSLSFEEFSRLKLKHHSRGLGIINSLRKGFEHRMTKEEVEKPLYYLLLRFVIIGRRRLQ